MKKQPIHKYSVKNGIYFMTAEMASESRLRQQKWLQHGCNGFDMKIPKSTPMAFWTEQDVLEYIECPSGWITAYNDNTNWLK